jgi:hypothetical protein
VTAFLDRYRVGDNRLETQHALVKRARLVEIEGREADMRKSLVFHIRCSSDFYDATASARPQDAEPGRQWQIV